MKTYSAIIRKGWIYYPMLWVTTLVFAVLCGQWLHTKEHATYAVPAVLLYAVIWVAIGKRRKFKASKKLSEAGFGAHGVSECK